MIFIVPAGRNGARFLSGPRAVLVNQTPRVSRAVAVGMTAQNVNGSAPHPEIAAGTPHPLPGTKTSPSSVPVAGSVMLAPAAAGLAPLQRQMICPAPAAALLPPPSPGPNAQPLRCPKVRPSVMPSSAQWAPPVHPAPPRQAMAPHQPGLRQAVRRDPPLAILITAPVSTTDLRLAQACACPGTAARADGWLR